jgi:hypothetical protein
MKLFVINPHTIKTVAQLSTDAAQSVGIITSRR